jgi:hypothetical protein
VFGTKDEMKKHAEAASRTSSRAATRMRAVRYRRSRRHPRDVCFAARGQAANFTPTCRRIRGSADRRIVEGHDISMPASPQWVRSRSLVCSIRGHGANRVSPEDEENARELAGGRR